MNTFTKKITDDSFVYNLNFKIRPAIEKKLNNFIENFNIFNYDVIYFDNGYQ